MAKIRPISIIYVWFSGLAILCLSIVITLLFLRGIRYLPVQQFYSTQATNAIWDWTNPASRSDMELNDMALFLYRHQINVVYLDISQTAESNMNDQYANLLNRYIKALKKYKIRTYAAAGNKKWTKPEERHKPLAFMNYVYTYNSSHDNKFAGIEFDIESYNQPDFSDASMPAKAIALTEYLDTADAIISKQEVYLRDAKHAGFDLGFAIPYWFDNENKNIPSVTWLGKAGAVGFHLMDRLNDLPNSNVVIMAYRNAARGNDGSIIHSATEVEYARYKASRVKVIIGFETTDVEPAKITYFGVTKTDMSREMHYITEEFGLAGVLGGTAINDLVGYQAMAE